MARLCLVVRVTAPLTTQAVGTKLCSRLANFARVAFELKVVSAQARSASSSCRGHAVASASVGVLGGHRGVTSASPAASRVAGVQPSDAGALLETNAREAAREAFKKFGKYRGNEVAWDTWAERLLSEVAQFDIQDLKGLAHTLAADVRLTRASIWDRIALKAEKALKEASVADVLDVARSHALIRAFSKNVFTDAIDGVRKQNAIHSMEAQDLTDMIELISFAGQMAELSGPSRALLFISMQDRILEDIESFDEMQCFSLVQSMARLRETGLRHVLQELGRAHLHEALPSMPGDQVAALCHAYGELGYRHDTVFKTVVQDVLAEEAKLQRDRVFGTVATELRYGGPEVALIALAMIRLKMHRGTTAWMKWEESYSELVDVLYRRLDGCVAAMTAQPLAAAAYVLGRARIGTVDLVAAMYSRMVSILEQVAEDDVLLPLRPVTRPEGTDSASLRLATDGDDPPQYELAQFLYGLMMMGPQRKKELDTFWLQQWLCNNLHTLTLSDFVLVNRSLVMMDCCEQDYLKMIAEQFFVVVNEKTGQCPIDNLTKTDILEVTHTYNRAGIREEHIGRHFFWALGRRYQDLQATPKASGRPALRRFG